MRQHFHRCGHLRVIALDASDESQARKGGSQILEELCEAKHLARCVGLAECDVLSPGQKRDLLTVRATRLREEEGGASPLADAPDARAAELAELRRDLAEEYAGIVAGNQRRRAEAGAALQRNPRPIPSSQQSDLAGAGVSALEDQELRELRTARLDALERGLEALAHGGRRACARCGRAIEIERLRAAPDTAVCEACARAAFPDLARPAWAEPEPAPAADWE